MPQPHDDAVGPYPGDPTGARPYGAARSGDNPWAQPGGASHGRPDEYGSPDVYGRRPDAPGHDTPSRPKDHGPRPDEFGEPEEYGLRPEQPARPDEYGARPEQPQRPDEYGGRPDEYGAYPAHAQRPDETGPRPDDNVPEYGSAPDDYGRRPDEFDQPDERTLTTDRLGRLDEYAQSGAARHDEVDALTGQRMAPEPASDPGPELAPAGAGRATDPAAPGAEATGSPWPATTLVLDREAPEGETAEPSTPGKDELLERLLGTATLSLDATRRNRLIGWAWTLGITLFAGILRFWNLGSPHSLVFDETYYVKDGWSLATRGYEAEWGDEPNPAFEAGDDSKLGTKAEYFVHPQVGKWLIGLGMRLGGGMESAFAWRLAVALVGTLSVLLMVRIARRLFASTAWGAVAGGVLAVDGLAIVMSRTSLLDPFLMFFALAAFGALLLDREQSRRRLAERTAAVLAEGRELGWGPSLGMRWWRLVAGVLLGLAIGTKWSGLYFLAVFGLLTVMWDATARRAVGARLWALATLVKDALVAALVMVGSALVVYVGSWWSWFTHSQSWGRSWAEEHPGEGPQLLPSALRSLWDFHRQMWIFHKDLDSPHTYQAHPLGWIVQWRPTSFYWGDVSNLSGAEAQDACGADHCAQAILGVGNPILWWAGAAAILVAIFWLFRYFDWVAGAALSGILAGWVPWLFFTERTIFTFYAIAFTPWVVLTLVYVLTLIVGPPTLPARARRGAIIGVGVFLGLLVGVGLYFYPIWAGWVVPYDFWHQHIWMRQWV